MWPFGGKAKSKRTLGGVRIPKFPCEKLSRMAERYRVGRIMTIAELTEKSVAEAVQLADRWIIHMSDVPLGGMEDSRMQFIPSPVWDDEWLVSRQGFNTREEAIAEVRRVGGRLLTDQ